MICCMVCLDPQHIFFFCLLVWSEKKTPISPIEAPWLMVADDMITRAVYTIRLQDLQSLPQQHTPNSLSSSVFHIKNNDSYSLTSL